MQEVGMPDDTTPPAGGQNGDEGGKEFKAPTSQAELDRIIGDRVTRERAKFADYDDLKTKAAEFDKVTEASKTELQREREAREAAEAELGKYRTREQVTAWAKEVAKERPDLAPMLRGSTKEELTEHFEQLKALSPSQRRTATPPGKPAPEGSEKGRAAAALRELRGAGRT